MRNERTNCARTRLVCLGTALAVLATLGIATTGQASNNRIGVTQARLVWAESTGLIDGYLVYTSRNGGAPRYESFTTENRYTVTGRFNDEVVLQVKAVGRASPGGPLLTSEFSQPSFPIRFIPAGSWASTALAVMASDTGSDVRLHSFRSPNSRFQLPGRGAPWVPIGAGLFTDDLLNDLLWQHEDTGALELTSLYDPNVVVAANASSDLPNQDLRAIGDVDGDGDLDLVMHDVARDLARVWRIASDGTIRRSTRLTALEGAEIVDVADFDGDGDEDVWSFDAAAERIVVHRGNGTGPIADAPIEGFDRVERIEDFDGDGYSDVLWRTRSGGFALSYLGASGETLDSVVYPATAFDAYFDVIGAAPMVDPDRLEVILSSRFDGSIWLMFPSLESAGNRFKVLDTDGEGFAPFEVLY